MDIKEIQNLIKFVSKSDVAEVSLKMKDFEIKVKNIGGQTVSYAPQAVIPQQVLAPQPAVAETSAQPAAAPSAETEDDSKYITVKSPMIGTFYRASGPDKEP